MVKILWKIFTAVRGVMVYQPQHSSAQGLRARVQQRLEPHRVPVRLAASAMAILLGFFLIEFAWNPQLFDMRPFHVAANLFFLAVTYAIIYFLGQRTRGAMVAFLAVCLVLGTANFYLVKFKGQPVVPADLLAFPTAAEVGGGYSFMPGWQVVVCLSVFAVACLGIRMLPKHPLNTGNALVSGFACLASVSMLTGYLLFNDISDDFDCEPDSWSTTEYYADYGAALCFMKRVQDLYPDWPAGYRTAQAEEVLASYDRLRTEGSGLVGPEDGTNAGGPSANTAQPTVLVVMNETFADISRLAGVTGSDARPARFYDIAERSIVSGTAYASAFAGGTCNSEFELLLGASMAFVGEDTYPYLFYEFDDVESLPAILEQQGYATAAVHPAEGRNWTRHEVYADLGFDAFYDIASFEEAETLRGMVTDRATYDFMLDLVREEEGPAFVFGITMQNHSGYTVGDLPEELGCNVRIGGKRYAEANEYASLIQRSDADLAYLVEQLEQLDEPVILLFFGDHQPYLSDAPKTVMYGWDPYETSLEQMQQRQEVPYLIWANYDTGASTSTQVSSINYLGVQLLQAANLPLSSYQSMLADLRVTVPAINAKGYLTNDGTWHAHGEEAGIITEALARYEMLQFANLFDSQIHEQAFIEGR